MGVKKYLTNEERVKIIEMRKELGVSIHEISRQLHRSRSTISRFLKDPEAYLKNMLENSSGSKAKTGAYQQLNSSAVTASENDDDDDDDDDDVDEETPSQASTPVKKKTPSTKTETGGAQQQQKIIKKDYSNAKGKAPSEDELKKFNRVLVEHRAVIKYLIKKGIGPRFIYEDIQKVYGKTAPDLPATLYWAKQYQQGRETILNESQSRMATISKPSAGSSNAKPAPSKNSKPGVKQLFKFKFKPLKRLQE